MKKLFLVVVLAGILSPVFSQRREIVDITPYTTCDNALEIRTEKSFGPTTVPATIESNSKGYFEKKLNVVWYKFNAAESGLLTFNIMPVDMLDNYDFILFKYTDGICAKVEESSLKPIASNFSRNNITMNGSTGLAYSSNYKGFDRGIFVKKGELYYLALNNVYENGKGHSIEFKYLDRYNIYFEPNRPDAMTIESDELLDEVVQILKSGKHKKIRLDGHTNGYWPSTPVDEKLSENRAKTVMKKLIEKGVSPELITVKALGSTQLLYTKASNEIEEGANRRVEIKFVD